MTDRDGWGDSAGRLALAWLEVAVLNTGDPDDDATLWLLTHASWRCEVASAFLGRDQADVGKELDVRALDDWEHLARFAVLHWRRALPEVMHPLGFGDFVSTTQFEVPVALDRVLVVFNDEQLDPGDYKAPVGTRVGFALSAVHEEGVGWTIAGVQPDWLMPAWMAELPEETN